MDVPSPSLPRSPADIATTACGAAGPKGRSYESRPYSGRRSRVDHEMVLVSDVEAEEPCRVNAALFAERRPILAYPRRSQSGRTASGLGSLGGQYFVTVAGLPESPN